MTRSPRHWPRYVGALMVAVVMAGTATAFAAISTVDGVLTPLKQKGIDPGAKSWLEKVPAGAPQTLLLIGSDKRSAKSADGARTGELSDTLMLARLDGEGGSSLLSIPRDTAVQVPNAGGGTRTMKINQAFAEGGEKLTLQAVRSLLGIKPSHVVIINFSAFERAINKLDCLHQDIDRSYFNDNSGGENYATIDVKAGYQLLCGADTLDWVRYRHADSDLVRAARQQEFLRAAKSQIAASKLAGSGKSLIEIFGRYTRTDIDDSAEVIGLLKLALDSSGKPLRSVKFRATEVPGSSDLSVSPSDLATMQREFRDPGSATSGAPVATKAPAKAQPKPQAARRRSGLATGLVKISGEAANPALQRASFDLAAGRLPVYFPAARLAFGGYAQRDPVRTYEIRPTRFSQRRYPAFRLTYSAGEGKYFGQFYGVQGTTWKDAPILREAHTTVRRAGRTLNVYAAGGRYRIVSWTTSDAVYWVSNSASLALGNKQMLDIAASLTRVPG